MARGQSSPLLFLIYINDFPLSSNFFKFIMYADDTTLYSQFDNARIANHDIELEINNELTKLISTIGLKLTN